MRFATLTLMLVLCACGGNDDGNDDYDREKEGVFDDMTGTIDKANEVEKKVLDARDRLDDAVKEAEDADDE